MYFYCVSFGEYEQYTETIFFHQKQFTEEEFEIMAKSSKSNDELCENYGFKKLEIQAHHHED